MAIARLPGGFRSFIGPIPELAPGTPSTNGITLDAVNEALIMIGRVATSDGGSHTIDTSGSSSLGWRAGAVTFANAGTTVKVGLAAVDTGNGPPARAANSSNVITFDVSASYTGGGGGIAASSYNTSVPTSGTKTIANGDLVAFAIQMTARGGSDAVLIQSIANPNGPYHRPINVGYLSAAYTANAGMPNVFITFADGATGWIHGGQVFSQLTTRTFNNTSSPREAGQLYNLPFPIRVYGIYGHVDPDADFDLVLYSDPLGTPVAQRTVSVDANTVFNATGNSIYEMFSTPYDVPPNTNIGVIYKPSTASNITLTYKLQANAAHRISDPWGLSGYGIHRTTGAFANANSSTEHYFIGLLVGGFEHGVWPMGHLGA